MSRYDIQADAEQKALLRAIGSRKAEVSFAALTEFSQALTLPLRQGVLSGDNLDNIYEKISLDSNATSEFPLDFLSPGTETDHVAYTIPNQGRIPERHVEGDFVMVPTFDVGNAIDWLLKYARDARWDVVSRATEVMEAGFVKKINDDGWHVLLSAAVDRNILIFDADASAGQFTKRLVSLMKVVMRRNAGGNSTSMNRGMLTDLYVSPEAIEDIRNWGVDQVDEITRREIFLSEDGTVKRIFSVNLHDIDELGVGQEYQQFYLSDLSASLGSGDSELVVGLDLNKNDSFVMPIRADLEVFPDPVLHRQRRAGIYGWLELGLGCLDNRRILAGSL